MISANRDPLLETIEVKTRLLESALKSADARTHAAGPSSRRRVVSLEKKRLKN